MTRPSHHRPDGRFRNPWPEAADDDAIRSRIREVAWAFLTESRPPAPGPGDLPLAAPDVGAASEAPLRVTWVGHATYLIQLPGLTVLTDPMWSPRASPVRWMGTKRFVPATPALDVLPHVDAVLLSHDHYDHLDRPTVRALHSRFGEALTWFTPLGYRPWFGRLGLRNVVELDWWDEETVGGYRLTAAPARHWTRRTPWGTNRRLWCSWALSPNEGREAAEEDPIGGGGRTGGAIYFGGDSAYSTLFEEIGERLGPFDASLLPIGAYDPRWFMKHSHMNPEEAVRVYEDLGGEGAFLPGHWGTFRLTFEDPLEPPRRLREAWSARGLDEERLRVLRHGETATVPARGGGDEPSAATRRGRVS